MHILEVYFESGGYDYNLIKGGISVYMWNLSKAMVNKEQQVSLLTALHGKLDYLREHYELEELPYSRQWLLKLELDPAIWKAQHQVELPLETKAYRLRKDGVDIYLLSNAYLDKYPDTFYPPYASKGTDIAFYKSLIFQMEAIFFIRNYFRDPSMIVHAHEPYYQYLLPGALAQDGYRVISTVQSNMPINKKVYKPKVASLFAQLGVTIDLDQFDDHVAENDFTRCLFDYLPHTHLNYRYSENYVNLYALVLTYSDKVDFLSEGHLEFYQSFEGTAFRALYNQLHIKQIVEKRRDQLFVGGCALSETWLAADFESLKLIKNETLCGLGLTPGLPCFYHNARYAPHHKGQVELLQAIEQILAKGKQATFILRCVSGDGIPDPRFHALQARYPNNIALIWRYQSEQHLMAMAAAADFSVFPSKFEMDTFLIAQGESMLAGCVPIASSQFGMKHWNHSAWLTGDDNLTTGFSIVRSFLEDDPQLVADLVEKIEAAILLYVQDHKTYQSLSQKAARHARQFTWDKVADLHLKYFSERPVSTRSDYSQSLDSVARYIREHGELISARAHQPDGNQALELPLLVSQDEIRYVHPQAQAVELFMVYPDTVVRVALPKRSGEFHFTPKQTAQNFFLLVTLHNGSQYWDGFWSSTSAN